MSTWNGSDCHYEILEELEMGRRTETIPTEVVLNSAKCWNMIINIVRKIATPVKLDIKPSKISFGLNHLSSS